MSIFALVRHGADDKNIPSATSVTGVSSRQDVEDTILASN